MRPLTGSSRNVRALCYATRNRVHSVLQAMSSNWCVFLDICHNCYIFFHLKPQDWTFVIGSNICVWFRLLSRLILVWTTYLIVGSEKIGNIGLDVALLRSSSNPFGLFWWEKFCANGTPFIDEKADTKSDPWACICSIFQSTSDNQLQRFGHWFSASLLDNIQEGWFQSWGKPWLWFWIKPKQLALGLVLTHFKHISAVLLNRQESKHAFASIL